MIAVLLVEYYEPVRAALQRALDGERDLAVVAVARGGVEALRVARKSRPDVILVGASLPDGAARVVAELKRQVGTPIIVFGEGQLPPAAIHALSRAGALDVVRLHLGPRGSAELCRALRATAAGAPRPEVEVPRASGAVLRTPVDGAIVAVAVSTGGPPVLARILGELPGSFAAPIVVVQHMTEGFLDQFVAWLGGVVGRPVKVAEDGEQLAPGCVYVAPCDRHLGVDEGGQLRVTDAPAIGGHRPSADVLFESLARCRERVRVGVILTGMGSDGARGLKALRSSGGHTIAQEATSCAVYGMPRAAVELGAADEVAGPGEIAARLVALAGGASIATGGEHAQGSE
ncbi:MAG: response regulator [Myxococcales bacterium]|nr:response regulator [Myxococcales bacterium]